VRKFLHFLKAKKKENPNHWILRAKHSVLGKVGRESEESIDFLGKIGEKVGKTRLSSKTIKNRQKSAIK
jgi:hypothetical protein